MKNRKLRAVLALILAVLLLAGCGKAAETPQGGEGGSFFDDSTEAAGETKEEESTETVTLPPATEAPEEESTADETTEAPEETTEAPEESTPEETTEETTEEPSTEEPEEGSTEAPEQVTDEVTPIELDHPFTVAGYTITMTMDTPEDDYYMGNLLLSVDGESDDYRVYDCVLTMGQCFLLQYEEGTYLIIEVIMENDWSITQLIKFNPVSPSGEHFEKLDEIDAGFTDKPGIAGREFRMDTKIDVFGSYSGIRTYHVENDQIITNDTVYRFYVPEDPAARSSLKTIRTVPVYMEDDSGAFTVAAELAPDTVIYPTGSDNESWFYFDLEDGTHGAIQYQGRQEGQWELRINGISETEYFEFLPYAG